MNSLQRWCVLPANHVMNAMFQKNFSRIEFALSNQIYLIWTGQSQCPEHCLGYGIFCGKATTFPLAELQWSWHRLRCNLHASNRMPLYSHNTVRRKSTFSAIFNSFFTNVCVTLSRYLCLYDFCCVCQVTSATSTTGMAKTFEYLVQKWPTSQRPSATFFTVLPQRATPYTWAHMNITPSLPHSRTYLCSARFIVNITHHWYQHHNDRNLQAIYYACYLVGLQAFLVLNNSLQILLVFCCCQSKQFFHMGVSQNRSMLCFHVFYERAACGLRPAGAGFD